MVPDEPHSSIGIVGGGQLALMLAEAAAAIGLDLHVQTPNAADPAVRLATGWVEASIDDPEGTRRLAERCGAISFENEWVPRDRLAPLAAEGVRFVPDLESLEPLLSKRGQRQLLDQLHLPCPRWCGLEQALAPRLPEMEAESDDPVAIPASPLWHGGAPYRPPEPPERPTLPPGFSFPVMAKASRGGYDGRGTHLLADQAALESLLDAVVPSEWILEERVAFERELALVACRDREGTVLAYPLVETHQHRQVCDWALMPAPVPHAVQAFARNVVASLLTALDYVGVLAVEFFYGPAGLLVNEIAPRTHNSGHLTIEACRCSQFSQQVRLVAGLPLGSPEPLVAGALMVNLLGNGVSSSPEASQQALAALAALPEAHLHWYGKEATSPGRKLGHLTLLLQGVTAAEREEERTRLLEAVRRLWPLPDHGSDPLE